MAHDDQPSDFADPGSGAGRRTDDVRDIIEGDIEDVESGGGVNPGRDRPTLGDENPRLRDDGGGGRDDGGGGGGGSDPGVRVSAVTGGGGSTAQQPSGVEDTAPEQDQPVPDQGGDRIDIIDRVGALEGGVPLDLRREGRRDLARRLIERGEDVPRDLRPSDVDLVFGERDGRTTLGFQFEREQRASRPSPFRVFGDIGEGGSRRATMEEPGQPVRSGIAEPGSGARRAIPTFIGGAGTSFSRFSDIGFGGARRARPDRRTIEERLEAQTGVQLDPEDIETTTEDGRITGQLSPSGQRKVAVERDPFFNLFRDTPAEAPLRESLGVGFDIRQSARERREDLLIDDPLEGGVVDIPTVDIGLGGPGAGLVAAGATGFAGPQAFEPISTAAGLGIAGAGLGVIGADLATRGAPPQAQAQAPALSIGQPEIAQPSEPVSRESEVEVPDRPIGGDFGFGQREIPEVTDPVGFEPEIVTPEFMVGGEFGFGQREIEQPTEPVDPAPEIEIPAIETGELIGRQRERQRDTVTGEDIAPPEPAVPLDEQAQQIRDQLERAQESFVTPGDRPDFGFRRRQIREPVDPFDIDETPRLETAQEVSTGFASDLFERPALAARLRDRQQTVGSTSVDLGLGLRQDQRVGLDQRQRQAQRPGQQQAQRQGLDLASEQVFVRPTTFVNEFGVGEPTTPGTVTETLALSENITTPLRDIELPGGRRRRDRDFLSGFGETQFTQPVGGVGDLLGFGGRGGNDRVGFDPQVTGGGELFAAEPGLFEDFGPSDREDVDSAVTFI